MRTQSSFARRLWKSPLVCILGMLSFGLAGQVAAQSGGDSGSGFRLPDRFGVDGGAFRLPPGFGFGAQPQLETQIEQIILEGDGCPRMDSAELRLSGASRQVLDILFAEGSLQLDRVPNDVRVRRLLCTVGMRLRVVDGRGAVPLFRPFFESRQIFFELEPSSAIVTFAKPSREGLLTLRSVFQVGDMAPTQIAAFELPVVRGVNSDGLPLGEQIQPIRTQVRGEGLVDVFAAVELRIDPGTNGAIRVDNLQLFFAVEER